jgi:hypothetical protein
MIHRKVIELTTGTTDIDVSSTSLGWAADSTGSTYTVEGTHDGSHYFILQASGTADTFGSVLYPLRKIRLNVSIDAGQVTLMTSSISG